MNEPIENSSEHVLGLIGILCILQSGEYCKDTDDFKNVIETAQWAIAEQIEKYQSPDMEVYKCGGCVSHFPKPKSGRCPVCGLTSIRPLNPGENDKDDV